MRKTRKMHFRTGFGEKTEKKFLHFESHTSFCAENPHIHFERFLSFLRSSEALFNALFSQFQLGRGFFAGSLQSTFSSAARFIEKSPTFPIAINLRVKKPASISEELIRQH